MGKNLDQSKNGDGFTRIEFQTLENILLVIYSVWCLICKTKDKKNIGSSNLERNGRVLEKELRKQISFQQNECFPLNCCHSLDGANKWILCNRNYSDSFLDDSTEIRWKIKDEGRFLFLRLKSVTIRVELNEKNFTFFNWSQIFQFKSNQRIFRMHFF